MPQERLGHRDVEGDRDGRPAAEITRRLLGKEGWMTWVTGHHFAKRTLVEACLRRAAGRGGEPGVSRA